MSDMPAAIVNITSKQKYWYQANLCTGDLLIYCLGYFMMCSSHHVALCNGCSIWSTARAPISTALLVYFGSYNVDSIASSRFSSVICWKGMAKPIPSLWASQALPGWSPCTGMKT